MKKLFLLPFVFFLCSLPASAQTNGVLGTEEFSSGYLCFSAGPVYLFGDIGGAVKNSGFEIADMNLKHVHFLYSLGWRQRFLHNRFGYKIAVQYGSFSGDDKGTRSESRGYAFNTDFFQASLLAEADFVQGYIAEIYPFSLYAYAGAGVISSRRINFTGGKIPPSSASKTSNTVPDFPVGIGFETQLSQKISLGIEAGAVFYFDDYVDGFAAPTYDDYSGNVMITLSYKVLGGKRNRDCKCFKRVKNVVSR